MLSTAIFKEIANNLLPAILVALLPSPLLTLVSFSKKKYKKFELFTNNEPLDLVCDSWTNFNLVFLSFFLVDFQAQLVVPILHPQGI